MSKEASHLLAISGYVLSLIVLAIMFFNKNLIIPKGYELSVDGMVISNTLILISFFYLLSKLGVFIYNSKTKQD
ncbi:hypothetical protein [Aeribacillus pallidus]|uniref:Uncharacterized protein n=1 Tax=Aeribacillus pallidus TaxID=33936 RepID=A0A165WWR7_9BACI|nr:hypothetical protein [Aeribacillus pallidus]KZN95406.1 hypothetical protein AZI98_14220 [Aeribacillus pallidus]